MDLTTGVAIYAAVVATAAGLIQLAQWRASRTKIGIQVNPGTAPIHHGKTDSLGNELAEDSDVVFIQLTNKSPHPVKISTVTAVDADDKQRGFVFPRPYPLELVLPFEIPPRDNRFLWVSREGLDAEQFKFKAKTAAGDMFETKPLVLDEQTSLRLHNLPSPT